MVRGQAQARAADSRPRRWVAALGLGAAGLSCAVALLAWLPLGRLQRWLGEERGLAVALGRARLAAGGRGLCVLLGDSRIEALGTWPAGCHLVNLGLPGTHATQWRSWLPVLDAGLPRGAQLALWVGINDLMHRHAPAETVARDLVVLLRGLARGQRTIHVMPQLAVPTDGGWAPGALNRASQRIDILVRSELGALPGVRFVEPGAFGVGAGGPAPDFYLDGLHPGDAANARLRSALQRAFQHARSAP